MNIFCIWYENRWLWVYEIKHLCFSVLYVLVYTHPSMAAHILCLLESLYISALVLTPFVPPVHNQGVSLTHCQGLALWEIFLPTTGSFFVNLTFTEVDLSSYAAWALIPGLLISLSIFSSS